MDIDFADLSPGRAYGLLASLIVPRPIAWATTLNEDGSVNAAPYSFFNCIGADPPLVVISIGNRGDAEAEDGSRLWKDTGRNLERHGGFVVNVVDAGVQRAMNATAGNHPPGASEVEALGLATAPAPGTDVPRIADAPAAFTCRHEATHHVGNNHIVFGRITHAFTRDGVIDPETMRFNHGTVDPIGRMAPPGWYCRTTDQFELDRPG